MSRYELVRQYGGEVLESETFAKAKYQVHHVHSDLASHSINTALVCITIWKVLSFFHIKVNLAVLIFAALVHDFGMLERDVAYDSKFSCLTQHPQHSVDTLSKLYPNLDAGVLQAVQSHMFPLYKGVPQTAEAWVLTVADKCAAVLDWFRHYSVNEIEA